VFRPLLLRSERPGNSPRSLAWRWLVLLALTGTVWQAEVATLRGSPPSDSERPASSPEELSPDLALYNAVIEAVRRGESYHAAAARELPRHGFESCSPVNWRLPTYAWVAGALPNTELVRWVLVVLALVAGGAVVRQTARADGPAAAIVYGWVSVGVLGWLFDGAAHLAQEVWCAVGLTGAIALRRSGRHLGASGVELACLFVRELVLPWLAIGLLVALWRRRWREVGLLSTGLVAWFAFFAWHVAKVREFSPPEQTITSGIGAWLAFGGVPFVLQTVRMNALLSAAPLAVVALFDVACLTGLVLGLRGRALRTGESPSVTTGDPSERIEFFGRLLVIALGYQLAFLVVGQSWHLYWGFLYAPILPLGAAQVAGAVARRLKPTASPASKR
jgi:hypothetical protein